MPDERKFDIFCIMMKRIKLLGFVFLASFLFLIPFNAQAEDGFVCVNYFTGVGCPHCAKTDPIVLEKALVENPDLVVIEYEIYQSPENASINYEISNFYDVSLGIPKVIFNNRKKIAGDSPIIKNFETEVRNSGKNECPLINGETIDFNELDIDSLPGKPKVWSGNKILIKNKTGKSGEMLKKLLLGDPEEILKENNLKEVNPEKVALSGKTVDFNRAIELDGWLFQWQTDKIPPVNGGLAEPDKTEIRNKTLQTKLTLTKILSLAAVDAVNPCALAVLTLILITILTYNPEAKKKVLWAGLVFALSVFIMYFFYGLVIVRFFQIIQALAAVRLWLYKILGGLAILLGVLNILDFVKYRPGRLGTEMPMFLRPKVKKVISRATSPLGAFIAGFLVTVFLLPCTIGPYVICGGILCALDLAKAVPWLLIYNLVFVLPMLVITAVVYLGLSKAQDVSGWKDKNIRYLHLVSGLIILGLGIAMLFGLV